MGRKLRIRSATVLVDGEERTFMQGDDVPDAVAKELGASAFEKVLAGNGEPADETPDYESLSDEDLAALKVDAVVELVGEDQERAQRALGLEQAKEKPRKSLVESLEKVLAGNGE